MSGLAHEVPWQLTHVGSHLHVWGAGGGGQDLWGLGILAFRERVRRMPSWFDAIAKYYKGQEGTLRMQATGSC